MLFNALCLVAVSYSLYQASWVYHDLMRNPKAYGRVVADWQIALLRRPISLWVSESLFLLTSLVGLLLALDLLLVSWQVNRRPGVAFLRACFYQRWKPLAAIVAAVAFHWSSTASFNFWAVATQHITIGTSPPTYEGFVLLVCACFPWWWLGDLNVEPDLPRGGSGDRANHALTGVPAPPPG